MIYEKLDYRVDIGLIRDYFINEVMAKYEPVTRDVSFGGWSIQSSNGDYRDGWHHGVYYFKVGRDGEAAWRRATIFNRPYPQKYVRYTQICDGCVRALMDDVHAMGLIPARARFALLPAGATPEWHRDAPDSRYMVRLHVPVITNEMCRFVTEEGAVHLPADGSTYILRVNRKHRIENLSVEDRVHIIVDVWDTKGVTKHHRCPEEVGKRLHRRGLFAALFKSPSARRANP